MVWPLSHNISEALDLICGSTIPAQIIQRPTEVLGVQRLRDVGKTGNADAQCLLGLCIEYGLGGSKVDFVEAARLYRLSAAQSNAMGTHLYGLCLALGKGVVVDLAESWRMKCAAANLGLLLGLAELRSSANMLPVGDQAPSAIECAAVRLHNLAAHRGVPEAQDRLAVLMTYGVVCEMNVAGAVEWFRQAANQGLPLAQRNLGICFDDGLGTPVDHVGAFRLFKLAADQGLVLALYSLALCYERGHGVEQDSNTAFRLYLEAADQGLIYAQNAVGLCFEHGRCSCFLYYEPGCTGWAVVLKSARCAD